MPLLLPQLLRLAQIRLDAMVLEGAKMMGAIFRDQLRSMPASMRTHFIAALSRSLDAGPRVEAYRRVNWYLVTVERPIILGDFVCLFETRGERRFKPIDDESDDCEHIFLPLAADRLLVGGRTDETPKIEVPALNDATARCSREFFVASGRLAEPDLSLANLIGTDAGIVSEPELAAMVDAIKRDLAQA